MIHLVKLFSVIDRFSVWADQDDLPKITESNIAEYGKYYLDEQLGPTCGSLFDKPPGEKGAKILTDDYAFVIKPSNLYANFLKEEKYLYGISEETPKHE